MTSSRHHAAAYHPRPTRGWLNDPNGLVRWEGVWHIFFQHNPRAAVHDSIEWGHLSSTDLISWREHPVAFSTTPGGPDEFGCWSGVFLPGATTPTVVYSGIADDSFQSTVCIRRGVGPELDEWGPPQVVAKTPHHAGVTVMRDPFIFTLDGRRWAALGARLTGDRPAVIVFDCEDLQHWTYAGVLLEPAADDDRWAPFPADIWECPQVLSIDGAPAVVISLQLDRVLGDVVVVDGALDLVDGVPRFVPQSVVRLDGGDSFYAPQGVADGDQPLMLGWVRQDDQPGDDAVAGCLTLPRRLHRVDGHITVRTDPAVEGLRTGQRRTLNGPVVVEVPPACVLDIDRGGAGPVHLLDGDGEAATATPLGGATVWVDGEVLEIFPSEGAVPETIRRQSAAHGWTLRLEEGASATVTEVELRNPAR